VSPAPAPESPCTAARSLETLAPMKSRVLLALLPLLACGGADVEPKSGTWSYQGSDIGANTCGDTVPVYPEGNFTLTVGSGGSFTVDPLTSEDPFSCSYGGGSFDCPERLAATADYPDYMVTVNFKVSTDGTFESPTELSGTQTANVDCVGSGCALAMVALNISQFPCSYDLTFTATAQ